MSKKTILWLGFGDIAARCCPILQQAGFEVDAVARSPKVNEGLRRFIQVDVTDTSAMTTILAEMYHYIVITLTPSGRDVEAYRRAYLAAVDTLVELLQHNATKPRAVLFASSTSVYGDSRGACVNERTPAQPGSNTASVLLESERRLLNASFPACTVRFSGIYGPGRFQLLKRVISSAPVEDYWTNRIHVDDCAGVIAFLLSRAAQGDALPEAVLASDNKPVKALELRRWLAERLNCPAPQEIIPVRGDAPSSRSSSNRYCDNSYLRGLGYDFRYPSYREGFPSVVEAFLESRQQQAQQQ